MGEGQKEAGGSGEGYLLGTGSGRSQTRTLTGVCEQHYGSPGLSVGRRRHLGLQKHLCDEVDEGGVAEGKGRASRREDCVVEMLTASGLCRKEACSHHESSGQRLVCVALTFIKGLPPVPGPMLHAALRSLY